MTQEEVNQVNTYISQLQASHAAQLMEMQTKLTAAGIKFDQREDFNKRSRHAAYHERDMANTAVGEIHKLCKGVPTLTPSELAEKVKQIMEYYCPDYDIPF